MPVSRSIAPDIDAFSSWSARGTRIAQPLSRKWRLISPTTFGRGVGRERDVARELEAVDRLDQADRADLLDVLERLAAPRVAAGQRANQRQVALDQLLARRGVALVVVAAEQLAILVARRVPATRSGAGRRSRVRLPLLEPHHDAAVGHLLHAERVHDRVEDAPERQLRPGARRRRCSASAIARSSSGPDARPDRLLAHLEAQLDGVARPGLGEQPLHGELEVVDLLEARSPRARRCPPMISRITGWKSADERRVEVDQLAGRLSRVRPRSSR